MREHMNTVRQWRYRRAKCGVGLALATTLQYVPNVLRISSLIIILCSFFTASLAQCQIIINLFNVVELIQRRNKQFLSSTAQVLYCCTLLKEISFIYKSGNPYFDKKCKETRGRIKIGVVSFFTFWGKLLIFHDHGPQLFYEIK